MSCKQSSLVRRWRAKAGSLQSKAKQYDEVAAMHEDLRGASWAVWHKDNGGIDSMTADFARGMAHGLRMAAHELNANSSP